MQRTMDDRNPQRRLNVVEQQQQQQQQYPTRMLAPAGQRFGDVPEVPNPFSMASYQVSPSHPTQALQAAALGMVGAGQAHHPTPQVPHPPPMASQPPPTAHPLTPSSAGQVNLDLFGDAMQVVNTSAQAVPSHVSAGGAQPVVQQALPQQQQQQQAPQQAAAAAAVTQAAAPQPPPPPHQQQAQQQQFQRLKVEDALSYLDQVKLQFGNQPQVYNDFLDIMKEFKSQSIDTPGVINRVSNLFKGHADLIVGFNTFLPPGYKIEVQSEMINVHQPGQTMYTIHSSNATVVQPPQQPTPPKMAAPATPAAPPLNAPAATHHTYHSPRPAPTPPEVPPAPPLQPAAQAGTPGPTNQPVEFNHAINYVNKIKNRFHGQPEIYKQFLEILHTYQKEQRNLKESAGLAGQAVQISLEPMVRRQRDASPAYQNQAAGKVLTESEVYAQVAKLFENQKDLLTEFGQFLPDANGSFYGSSGGLSPSHSFASDSSLGVKNDHSTTVKKLAPSSKAPSGKTGPVKRPSSTSGPPTKKAKLSSSSSSGKDFSVAQASQHGSLSEFHYFDKVRKSLHNQDVYDNFLRCVQLFNQDVLNRAELVQLTQVFFVKFPELHKWFKEFLDYKESGNTVEMVPHGAGAKERISGELAMEIDFTTCKRFGASYRSLPKSYIQPRCGGRTQLCREVLNDTYVSFPSWSEDSTFVTSRKTQYEEHIYKCEDERFELDVIIETNLSAIRVLESVKKKLDRMSQEDQAKFRLDNSLGGNSEVLTRKALQRLYGDKAGDIIDGLKKNPIIAVPLVLRRLRAKEEEWREARHGFNKVWREQNEKFYLKSLDHQGLNFKQADIKAIRSKQLLNEIEQAFDERAEQMGGEDSNAPTGPHLTFTYSDPSLIDDVTGLIMHHMKRHTGIHKEEKTKIKALLLHFLPDMFHMARGEFSDDEGDDMETDEGEPSGLKEKEVKEEKDKESQQARQEPSAGTSRPTMNGHLEEPDDDLYSLAFLHSNWYLFFRLHHMAAERLHKINSIAQQHIQEAETMRKERKESTAIALRLKQPLEVEPEEYYTYFLDMVKSLLDGNLESTAYEDQLREIFGINAYIAFTMDKIIMNLVRQLQHITSDEVGNKVNAMYQTEATNGATGGRLATQHLRAAAENAYQRKAEQLLMEDSCFKITMYKQGCRMAIEMVDVESTPSEDPGDLTMWNDYIEKYTQDSASADLTDRRPVFLNRNVRQFTEHNEAPRHSHQPPAPRPEESDSDPEREKDGGDGSQSRQGSTSTIAGAIRSHEKMGCHFPPNSYKRYFIHNSASIFYRTPKITQARESHKGVTLRKHTQFDKFVSRWRREHVSSSAEEQCQQWLLGRAGAVGDMRPCRTLVKKIYHTDRAPYYQYCKYQVEFLDSPKPLPPTVSTAPPTAPPVLAKPPPPTAPAPPTAAGETERE